MSPSVRRDGRKRGGTRTTRIAGTTTATGSPAEVHVRYTWYNINEHKTVSPRVKQGFACEVCL